MGICGFGTESYLYINGISTSKEIILHDNIVLSPVTTTFDYEKIVELLDNIIDCSVAAISGYTITSQLHITAPDAEKLTILTWNSLWDCILLGALFNCEVMGNIQCDKPVEELRNATYAGITNYAFRALLSDPYLLTEGDEKWILQYYNAAHQLLDNEPFMTAVHAMASYRWHTMPRVQLAILWSGIEALFEASSEISFRISLYIANFLAGNNAAKAKELFEKTKKLYSSRSAAVHGGKIKGDIDDLVSDSAALLNQIIRRCAELGALPNTQNLVFPSTFMEQTEG